MIDVPVPEQPRVFRMIRETDHSGISGTGHVADGVVWPDGSVTLKWRGEHSSTADFGAFKHVDAVHGHNGDTCFEFVGPVGE